MTLVELLTVIALIALLVSLLLPVVIKAQRWCKEWAYGAFAYKQNQLETYLDDNAKQYWLDFYTTNKPVRWSFVEMKPKP